MIWKYSFMVTLRNKYKEAWESLLKLSLYFRISINYLFKFCFWILSLPKLKRYCKTKKSNLMGLKIIKLNLSLYPESNYKIENKGFHLRKFHNISILLFHLSIISIPPIFLKFNIHYLYTYFCILFLFLSIVAKPF